MLTDTQVQTAFLLGMANAAARARLPVRILAHSISRWHSNAASGGHGCVKALSSSQGSINSCAAGRTAHLQVPAGGCTQTLSIVMLPITSLCLQGGFLNHGRRVCRCGVPIRGYGHRRFSRGGVGSGEKSLVTFCVCTTTVSGQAHTGCCRGFMAALTSYKKKSCQEHMSCVRADHANVFRRYCAARLPNVCYRPAEFICQFGKLIVALAFDIALSSGLLR
jgi:hypothetical protein